MVSGYKHFSHTHKLVIHDLPEGADVTCSGCNSLAKNTIYICWQCNFVLHVQCYQATRSKKHPSHPEHSLTLVPYPTYPSNSFYCNSCKIVGTGFSYSCADCEFDLHVQCAYSISDATNHPITNPHPHTNSHSNQETMVPDMIHNGQYSSLVSNFASVSIANQIPAPAPVSASTPVHSQYPIASPNSHDSSYQNQEPVPPYMLGHNSSIPAQYSTIVSQDSYTTQHSTPFYAPTSSPNPNISHQNAYVSQHFTSVPPSHQNPSAPPNNTYVGPPSAPIEQHPSHMIQNATSYPNPTTTHHFTSVPPNPQNSSMAPNNTYAFVPPIVPNQHPPQDSYTTQNTTSYPNTSPQNAYISQNSTSLPPSPYNSSKPDNNTYVVPPNAPNEHVSHYVNASQNKPKNLGIKHFSHPHGLVMVNVKRGKKQIACSGCEETLVGKGYACVEENCGFQIDESCFNLEKEIQHKSHPPHKLYLLAKSPYQNHDTFICSACFEDGSGFTYHCSICEFDLHVKCANLKETVKRDDHDHELKLFYECPLKGDEYTFYCDVCNRVVQRDHWTYYCKECDFGTHLNCVDREICNEVSDHEEEHVETLAEVMEAHRIQAIGRKAALDNI